MAVITLGRLALGPPGTFVTEPVGDPVGTVGGSVVPAARAAQQVLFDLNTILSGGSTLTNAQTSRRQLRSALNNTPLKSQAFLYLVYSDDSEQNGWLVPQPANITSPDNNAWKAVGLWEIVGSAWYLAGRQRGMREARSIWMKDLRSGLYERDQLEWIVSSDFSALPALPLTVLPHGATQIENTTSGQVPAVVALPTGRDGGICQLAYGPVANAAGASNLINGDLNVLSYERAEAALNLSDVIAYDRRGQITSPPTGPDTLWEEAYGPDYPWNCLTSGQANDAPVLDNGLVRVRYDGTNTPGFRVDIWNGAAYVEQGKVFFQRIGDSGTVSDDTWVWSGLVEYTPDRAVLMCVLRNSTDAYSRERVYITLQRGEIGAGIEIYPSMLAAGSPADAKIVWTPALNTGTPDLNNSILKIDSQGSGAWTPGAVASAQNTGPTPGVLAATAGTGAGTGNSGRFGGVTTLGASNFSSSENWVAILRYPTVYNAMSAYQTTLTVVQAANVLLSYQGSSSGAYGVSTNAYFVTSQNGAGYLQAGAQFNATSADQVLEAESMTLGANTASTADAGASGGTSATSTRTTDANLHVSRALWPNSFLGTYRVSIRVKVSANSASFYAKTGATTGATVTCNSTTYTWIDLGEITSSATTLELHAWMSGGAGTVSVDRMEAVLVQDRLRGTAIFSGARDGGQAALFDSRTLGALSAR